MLYREIIAICSEIHTKHITRIIYKDPVRTAQKTHCISITKTSQSLLYGEIINHCSNNHDKKKFVPVLQEDVNRHFEV